MKKKTSNTKKMLFCAERRYIRACELFLDDEQNLAKEAMRYEKIRDAAARMKANMRANMMKSRTIEHVLLVRECIRTGPESLALFEYGKIPKSLLRHPDFRNAYVLAEQASVDFQLYTFDDV